MYKLIQCSNKVSNWTHFRAWAVSMSIKNQRKMVLLRIQLLRWIRKCAACRRRNGLKCPQRPVATKYQCNSAGPGTGRDRGWIVYVTGGMDPSGRSVPPCPNLTGGMDPSGGSVPPCPNLNGGMDPSGGSVPPCPNLTGEMDPSGGSVPPCPNLNGEGWTQTFRRKILKANMFVFS